MSPKVHICRLRAGGDEELRSGRHNAMAAGSKPPSDSLRELLCLCKPTISSVAWVAWSQTVNGAEETKMWRFWAGMLTPGAAVARIV